MSIWDDLEGYGYDGPLGNAHSLILSVLETTRIERVSYDGKYSEEPPKSWSILTLPIIENATKILDGVPVSSDVADSVNSAWLAMERAYDLPWAKCWVIANLQALEQRTGAPVMSEYNAFDYFDERGMQKRIPGFAGFVVSYAQEISEDGYWGFLKEQWYYGGRETVKAVEKAAEKAVEYITKKRAFWIVSAVLIGSAVLYVSVKRKGSG